ncbi:hypothetical protein RI129_011665 [Pyrocoelia pectoralis]|uniref:Uncharacterized protein n=1 Tax=Pyrocoelia pectoralis TaxID=417401 RepID=A0AAN7ZHC8_9COLE
MSANNEWKSSLTFLSNSLVDGGNFSRVDHHVNITDQMLTQIVERFGYNATVVFTSQNYAPCVTVGCCYDNFLEIYNIKNETTRDTIIKFYSAFTVDIVWISGDKALAVFNSTHEANSALLEVQTTLFKARKLLYASDRAITGAINLAYPKGSNEFVLRHELPASTPEQHIDVTDKRELKLLSALVQASIQRRRGK